MKCFKLLLLIALFAVIFTGCERELISPVDPTIPSQTTSEFAQEALLNLANTAAERAFVDLAEASKGVAETLAVDDGTSVEPLFSKIAELASAVTILEHAFVEAKCDIELRGFAHATIDTVKAYTIRVAADMERTLQNLAREAVKAKMELGQLPVDYNFVPFAFGYGPVIDGTLDEFLVTEGPNDPLYVPGLILIKYNSTIRSVDETRDDVLELLNLKGYSVQVAGWSRFISLGKNEWFHLKGYTAPIQIEEVTGYIESIDLGAEVDPLLIMRELFKIPGVAHVQPDIFYVHVDPVHPQGYYIVRRIAAEYNETWCQNNFDVIDSILIGESRIDFFDYDFVRDLADIYAEEVPESAERIRMNRFSIRWISEEFLDIYSLDRERPLDEVINLFRQSVRAGNLSIEHRKFNHYYHTTDYWKQLVTDHLNQ